MDSQTSQLDLLAHDINVYRQFFLDHPEQLHALGDRAGAEAQTYAAITVDLFWQSLELAAGIEVLLRRQIFAPINPVVRALFESTVTLNYLRTRPDPIQEACILRAYSVIRWLEVAPETSPQERSEREEILHRMPDDLVAKARERMNRQKGWSGKSLRSMVQGVGFSDYKWYSYLSEDAHARLLGEHIVYDFTKPAEPRIHLGRPLLNEEQEDFANAARLMLLYAFESSCRMLGIPKAIISTEDPRIWSALPREPNHGS